MTTFTINEMKEIARVVRSGRTASAVLNESAQARLLTNYDIFLSHSYQDAEIVLGIRSKLEKYGYKVYVDWMEDPQMDRSAVTAETAQRLRDRMNRCRCLFYATTQSSSQSKWMPWECGYIDGRKDGRSAILPVTATGADTFLGQEYLKVYPYVTEGNRKSDSKKILWINESPRVYFGFDMWLRGSSPTPH